MINKLKVLAIIPARGGSKRLKNKNILLLNKKPLIAYTIEAAKKVNYIDKVLVSTDSEKIAQVAKKYGAEVPFLRPKNISGDKTSDYPVLAHAIKYMAEKEGFQADIIVFLRPTVPLREKGLVRGCIETLVKGKGDSVRSVRNVGRFHPYWMLKIDKHGVGTSFLKGKTIDEYYQHQLLPDLYEHDGYCDCIMRRNIDINCKPTRTLKGLYGKKLLTYLNHDRKPLVNIDTREDFELSEFLIQKNK